MGKFAGVLVMAGLCALTIWTTADGQKPKVRQPSLPVVASKTAEGEKGKPSLIEGAWEATVKRMDGGREVTQRIVFRDGLMLYTRPNDLPEGSGDSSVRIEADFTVIDNSPVYGKVLSTTGEAKAVKGDEFFLDWQQQGDTLFLLDPKGKGMDGMFLHKVRWTRKP